jgi:hypothetical protein
MGCWVTSHAERSTVSFVLICNLYCLTQTLDKALTQPLPKLEADRKTRLQKYCVRQRKLQKGCVRHRRLQICRVRQRKLLKCFVRQRKLQKSCVWQRRYKHQKWVLTRARDCRQYPGSNGGPIGQMVGKLWIFTSIQWQGPDAAVLLSCYHVFVRGSKKKRRERESVHWST